MALPDVEVGSIVEYGYHIVGSSFFSSYSYLNPQYAPWWQVQQAYHLCSGHFQLKTSGIDRASVRWVSNLPSGSQVQQIKDRVELDVSDVAPLPDEEFTPPPSSLRYRVRFFYWTGDSNTYWGWVGSSVENEWKSFYSPTKGLTDVVSQIVGSTDTDEQKLRKIYDAVMGLENTDLTRERTGREDKQSGLKEAKKSEDIWRRKRGDSQELTFLFVALARAAGFDAYPMAITSRDYAIFNRELLSGSQMDSTSVVIDYKGQARYLDPGCRGCPYGHLAWWHSSVRGVSMLGSHFVFRETPPEPAGANRTQRVADLKIDEHGVVTGTVKITCYDLATLPLRRQLLREDQQAVETALQKELQEQVPVGIETKLLSLDIPGDYSSEIVASFSISGNLGTAAGNRLLMPEHFFASTEKPLFAPASRTLPVSFAEASAVKDIVQIQFPKTMALESLPESRTLSFAKDIVFSVHASTSENVVVIQRLFVLRHLDTLPEYADLHIYFVKMAGYDQDQLVLHAAKP